MVPSDGCEAKNFLVVKGVNFVGLVPMRKDSTLQTGLNPFWKRTKKAGLTNDDVFIE